MTTSSYTSKHENKWYVSERPKYKPNTKISQFCHTHRRIKCHIAAACVLFRKIPLFLLLYLIVKFPGCFLLYCWVVHLHSSSNFSIFLQHLKAALKLEYKSCSRFVQTKRTLAAVTLTQVLPNKWSNLWDLLASASKDFYSPNIISLFLPSTWKAQENKIWLRK